MMIGRMPMRVGGVPLQKNIKGERIKEGNKRSTTKTGRCINFMNIRFNV
jgi:hypothetical protein